MDNITFSNGSRYVTSARQWWDHVAGRWGIQLSVECDYRTLSHETLSVEDARRVAAMLNTEADLAEKRGKNASYA